MIKEKEIIRTVMDIGNSKIKILVGEVSEEGKEIKVIGYNETPSQGLKKSLIENPEALTRAIEEAVRDIEFKIDRKIESVRIGISSPNIKSRTVNKKIYFSETVIGDKEIEELYEDAEKGCIKPEERIIKREMYNIRVNNSGILKTPKGVIGKELQGDIHFISLNELELHEYEELINRAGLVVEKIELNVYGAANSILDEEEKSSGVALIDIGEGITDIMMYKNGKMIHSKSIPLGCVHYINDLSYILEIPKNDALDILKKLKERDITDEKIIVGDNKNFTVNYIRNIIDARTEDIAKFIIETIEESGFNGYLGKGIVITGGAIVLDELLKKISQYTGYKVAKKDPVSIEGLENVNSSMASVIGIMLEIKKDESLKSRNKEFSDDSNDILFSEESGIFEQQSNKKNNSLDEENTEEKEPKESWLDKVKEIISNYI